MIVIDSQGKDIPITKDGPVFLGRSKLTGITHLKCSRQQVKIEFDSLRQAFTLTRLGIHRSFVNGKVVERGQRVILSADDEIHLLKKGRFPFRVQESAMAWREVGTELHVFSPPGNPPRSRVLGLDLDGTLITTKSGLVFPRDEGDWRLLYPEVPGALRRAHDEGFHLVIFTNQKGIQTGRLHLEPFKRKIAAVLAKIPVPIQVFISTGVGEFRKPLPGMWTEMEAQSMNGGTVVDRARSIYVGDAAGRSQDAVGPKDHSCFDRLFALNLGVQFQTPEEFFLGRAPRAFRLPDFDPRTALTSSAPLLEPSTAAVVTGTQELILMVGCPASGKSHFVETYLRPKNYEVISRDAVKDSNACVRLAKRALENKRCVVIDNTNPDKASRRRYLAVCSECNVPARCFWMKTSHAQAIHNVRFRKLMGTDREHREVNEMVLNTHWKRFQEPGLEEGLSEIVRVNFVPIFDDQFLRQRYGLFLVGK